MIKIRDLGEHLQREFGGKLVENYPLEISDCKPKNLSNIYSSITNYLESLGLKKFSKNKESLIFEDRNGKLTMIVVTYDSSIRRVFVSDNCL